MKFTRLSGFGLIIAGLLMSSHLAHALNRHDIIKIGPLNLRTVYRRLEAAGFAPGPYNSADLTQLSLAIKRFQHFARLPEDGVLEPQTWEKMQKLYDPGASAPSLSRPLLSAPSRWRKPQSLVPLNRARSSTSPTDWTENEGMLHYFDAITHIKTRGLQSLTPQQIVRGSLKAYLQHLDPFSDYLSPQEYANFRRSQQRHYAGVGMLLSQNATGQYVCIPYPDSPAARAGIVAGDVLKAVDGRRIDDRSILSVGADIRGRKGSEIRLRVSKAHGGEADLKMTRAPIRSQSVLLDRYGDLPIVRILSFTAGTPEELQNLFATLDQTTPAVLDLRGNPGGSLYDAIDAAMLFLNNGQKVVTLRTREGSRIYRRNLPAAPFTAPLYLWQDAYTASAAEVFIAALQQNQRAVSIGRKTFGKSTVQKLIALSDGSALYLTTSDVQTPNGNLYHQHGLDPTYRLDKPRVETEDYLAKVKVLMRTRK